MAQPSPSSIAANLSCLLYLARHKPEGDAEVREAALVFLRACGDLPLLAEAAAGWLSINGAKPPGSATGVQQVHEHLISHGVHRLELPRQCDVDDVIAVARTLAAYPGTYTGWDEFLAALGPAARTARLTRAGTDLPFIRYDAVEDAPLPTGRPTLMEDILPMMSRPVLEGETEFILPAVKVSDYAVVSRNEPAQPARDDPAILQSLIHRSRSAEQAGDTVALLTTAHDFLGAAEQASSESAARNYRLELKRVVSRPHLVQFARLAASGAHREIAIDVLRQLGSDATEVLMDLLVEADSLAERRGYYSALSRMPDGTEIIIHHLDHPTWYVVRNAAELCGEMALAKAVPHLGRQASHPDERVRKSVALALNRIGTGEALEPLGRMLKDPSHAIRLQVLGNLHGPSARPLAMPLAARLETEEHPDVLRELLMALGRIGTPDALLALRRVAHGELRRLARRHRVQAIEALALAGAPAAQILRSLAKDSDSEIGGAATRALEGIPA